MYHLTFFKMNLIIWIAFIGIAVFYNWLLIEKHISPWHPLNASITIIFAIVFAYYDPRPNWFVIPCALSTYWFLFDTGLNLARGKIIWYLGQGSVIDRLSQKAPLQVVWILKGILALGFIGCYYANF